MPMALYTYMYNIIVKPRSLFLLCHASFCNKVRARAAHEQCGSRGAYMRFNSDCDCSREKQPERAMSTCSLVMWGVLCQVLAFIHHEHLLSCENCILECY